MNNDLPLSMDDLITEGLSEEETAELLDSINRELEELQKQRLLATESINYWPYIYIFLVFVFGGLSLYFGGKLFAWRDRKWRKDKLKKKIEKRKVH